MKRLVLVLSAICLALVAIVATRAILSDTGGAESAGPVPSAADTTTEAKLSREQVQELRRAANTWASLFATNACNRYMGQPMCERLDCAQHRVEFIENCTPVSAAFQTSFADATVEDIKLKGVVLVGWTDRPLYEAAVKFSNGEVVVFAGVRGPEPPAGSCAGPGSGCAWNIAEPDQNRRFLEAAAPRQ